MIKLTNAENAIYKLILEGKSNEEIAQLLYVTQGTVKTHVANILRKLQQPTRLKLMAAEIKRLQTAGARR